MANDNELRGGTQTGGGPGPQTQVETLPGGTAEVQRSTGPRVPAPNPDPPDREEEGVRRDDLYRVFDDESSRKPSAAAATQQARADANVPPEVSRNGVDPDNPRQIPPETPTP